MFYGREAAASDPRSAPLQPQHLAALVADGENERLEFKSTMRWNLRADKPGKEIELAWLKTVVAYLNTDGGFVVIGVKDDGTVLGLDRDDFRNDDKLRLHFENLIKQHVGLLHAPYVRGEIREVGGSDRTMVVPDTYRTVEKHRMLPGVVFDSPSPGMASPTSLEGFLSAIPRGMMVTL